MLVNDAAARTEGWLTWKVLPSRRFHPSSYRYHLYHEFMKTTGLQYQRVQACDIRDVAFQADPFRSVRVEEPDAVHIFQEDASMTIGRCGVNSNWIRGESSGGERVPRVSSTPSLAHNAESLCARAQCATAWRRARWRRSPSRAAGTPPSLRRLRISRVSLPAERQFVRQGLEG